MPVVEGVRVGKGADFGVCGGEEGGCGGIGVQACSCPACDT